MHIIYVCTRYFCLSNVPLIIIDFTVLNVNCSLKSSNVKELYSVLCYVQMVLDCELYWFVVCFNIVYDSTA